MSETHITLRIPRLRHVLHLITGRARREAALAAQLDAARAQGFAAGVAFMKEVEPGWLERGRALQPRLSEFDGVTPVYGDHEMAHVVQSAAGRAAVGVFFLGLVSPSLLLAATAQLWAF